MHMSLQEGSRDLQGLHRVQGVGVLGLFFFLKRRFPKIRIHFVDPHKRDYSLLGPTLESPYFGKLLSTLPFLGVHQACVPTIVIPSPNDELLLHYHYMPGAMLCVGGNAEFHYSVGGRDYYVTSKSVGLVL